MRDSLSLLALCGIIIHTVVAQVTCAYIQILITWDSFVLIASGGTSQKAAGKFCLFGEVKRCTSQVVGTSVAVNPSK